jgi:hypothetical protein
MHLPEAEADLKERAVPGQKGHVWWVDSRQAGFGRWIQGQTHVKVCPSLKVYNSLAIFFIIRYKNAKIVYYKICTIYNLNL